MGILWIAIALLTILLAGGSIFTNLMGHAGAETEERTLRLIASWAAASLDVSAVATLTGSPGDSRTYGFARVRAELKKIHRALPDARFTYLMARRGRDVIFLADAEEVNSPDYSPPGQIYPNPSAELLSVFAGADALVEQPYRDRWGEWASGLAPVKDRETGRVIAVLGIDIPADRWRRQIDGYRIWGFVIAALIVALMAGVLLAQWREQRGY